MSNDIKAWKDLLSDLQDISEENKLVLSEIQNQVEIQKQRNKKEVHQRFQEVQGQIQQLAKLLEDLRQADLFPLEVDQKGAEKLVEAVNAQIEKSSTLVDYASNLLMTETIDQEAIDSSRLKTRKNKERSLSYHPKRFKEDYLLGNWICYQSANSFTCQSFWKDHTFKEYDFTQSRLKNEREGTYRIEGSRLILQYPNRKSVMNISGFNNDTIDYQVNDKSITYQYMPAELLNSFLDGASGKK